MRITCPKCQFQGLIDVAPLAFETRVACVRCGETFDALLIEGEILTSLPVQEDETPMAQVEASDAEEDVSAPLAEVEDVLALPQVPSIDCQFNEEAPVLDEVLHVVPATTVSEAQEDALARPVQESVMQNEVDAQSLDEAQFPVAEFDDEDSFKSEQPLATAAATYDNPSVGMRLMRISPLWLLACGVIFVSVIILSNQFARSASQRSHVAMKYAAPNDGAANRALPQPPAAANASVITQAAAPAPSEVKDDAKAIQGEAGVKVQDEPKPAPSIAPVVETKKEVVPAPAAQPRGEGTGGYTIQVGSYNVIEQANTRVARLQSDGFNARVAVVEIPQRGTWYRVQAGRFSSREDATSYGNQLRAKGAVDSFIIAEVGK